MQTIESAQISCIGSLGDPYCVPIWINGANVGVVSSGTQSPSLGVGIGMGYLPPEFAKKDTAIEIEIRGKRAAAIVVARPIYRKS